MAEALRHPITRRAVVAAAAAGVPAAAGAARLDGGLRSAHPPYALAAAPDQKTLAAIAAHRAASAALDAACLALSALERRIPEARRQAQFDDEIGTGAGANDDPRWTTGLAAYHAASDAESAAAWALAHFSRRRLRTRWRSRATPTTTRTAAANGRGCRSATTAATRIGTSPSTRASPKRSPRWGDFTLPWRGRAGASVAGKQVTPFPSLRAEGEAIQDVRAASGLLRRLRSSQ
jgi:hypothetical protein